MRLKHKDQEEQQEKENMATKLNKTHNMTAYGDDCNDEQDGMTASAYNGEQTVALY